MVLFFGMALATGLSKYAGKKIRQRASSPKLQVLNTALMTALVGGTFAEAKTERDLTRQGGHAMMSGSCQTNARGDRLAEALP